MSHPQTPTHTHMCTTITHLPAQPAEVTGTVNIYLCLLTPVKMTSTTAIYPCLLLTPLKWPVQLTSPHVCYWHLSNDQYNWHLPMSVTNTSQMTSTTDINLYLSLTSAKCCLTCPWSRVKLSLVQLNRSASSQLFFSVHFRFAVPTKTSQQELWTLPASGFCVSK